MNGRPLALVTGASSGIGAEFARQLASGGYNLILSARREDRLRATAAELTHDHGSAVEIIAADLDSEPGIAALEARAAVGDIHLLVNNAGFGIVGPFVMAELAGQLEMISVHVIVPMRLMHVALPAMLERRSGGVINVASLAAFVSLPRNANYSGTKSYLMRFSRTVHAEVRSRGVTVQALCPGLVRSEFHDDTGRVRTPPRQYPSFAWMTPAQVVKDSLRGFDRRKSLVVPGALYKMAYLIETLGIADALIPYVPGIR